MQLVALAPILKFLIAFLVIALILYLLYKNLGIQQRIAGSNISAANTSLTSIKTTLQTIAQRPSMMDSEEVIQKLIDQLERAVTQLSEGYDAKAFDCKTANDFKTKLEELVTVLEGMVNAGMFPDSDIEDEDVTPQEARQRELQEQVEALKELLDKLKAQLELCKRINLALAILNGTAGGELDNDDRVAAVEDGQAAAGEIPEDPVINDLAEKAEELQEEVAARPTLEEGNAEVTSSSVLADCDTEQDARNIAFGDSEGIELGPGCCLVIRFSPKLDDNWEYSHGDVEINVSDDATYSVEGKARSRDEDTSYTDLERDSGDTWEIPGGFNQMRFIRICNTGDEPMTVTQVRRR